MFKKLTNKTTVLLAASLLSFSMAATAKTVTPMEVFIQREKEANTFVTVNDIWQADNKFDQTDLLQKVEKAQPLLIDYSKVADLINQKIRDMQLVVPKTGGGTYTINLGRFDFFADNFKVEVVGADGSGFYNYKGGAYYRGTVEGIPGSVAAFSFFNNEVYGIFSIPNEGNYVLVPNTMVGTYYGSNQHYILYNDNDLKIKDKAPGCATDDMPSYLANKPVGKVTTTLNNNIYTNCKEVRVYEFADYSTWHSKGSTLNTMNYLTALFNNQSTLYKNESVLTDLFYVKIDTVTDAYQSLPTTSSLPWLTHFSYNTQNNLNGADVAIMITTKGGQMGGVAWLQSMCTSYYAPDSAGPYAFCNIDNSSVVNFPTFSWDVEVTTHEMGHIVGSPHTHRCCWNPPGTGSTAIDGCYTLEGSCAIPNPQYPVGGGTIMSYCHLTSDGINFSNGFGIQPGDTIRHFIAQQQSGSGCGQVYNPTVALSTVNRTVTANRECTDVTSGITYYWNDNNTASQADDTLALMIKKNGNNIGTMDSSGFSVTATTLVRHGSGKADTLTFPSATPDASTHNYAMRRYWKINATTQPTSNVEVMFPFMAADTADVHGSIPGIALPLSDYDMYIVKSPIITEPLDTSFSGATASNFAVYTYSTTATATHWSFSNVGSTYFANMLTTDLAGGGSGFVGYPFVSSSVAFVNPNSANIFIYPNPAHDQWFVSISNGNGQNMSIQLYTADGKVVREQILQGGTINSINAANLPAGFYFYRIVSSDNIYTGNLVKQ